MTLRCTSSICAWHWVQVATTFLALIVDLGSACGRMLCAEWQEVQTAVTVRPFWKSPSPWIESA